MVERSVDSSVCEAFVSDDRKKMRVLHVDDDRSFLNVAKQCLEIDGAFEIDTATSVDEAFEKMRTKTYDAVISDYQMPGKDGLDFLEELRQRENTIPFIVFTGKGREEVAVKALNLGANQYLNKTGEPETVYTELAHGIREVVRSSRALAEGKRNEETAKESERKYHSLYCAMSEGVCFHEIIYDKSGKAVDYVITDANPAFESITGIRREEAVGCRASKLYGTNEPPYLDVYSKVAASGEPISFETYFPPMKKHFSISVFSLAKGMFATVFCDSTERKKTEQELRRFSSAVKASLDGIITGDLNGNIAEVNEAALRMYGSDDKRDLIGKNVQDLLVERDRTRALQNAIETTQTGQGKTVEYTALTKNGIEVPIEVTTQLRVDEKGEPTGFVDIFRNLTERKKAEEHSKRTANEWSRTFDAIPELMFIIDKECRIVRVNKKTCNFLKKRSEELLGKHCYEVMHGRDRPWPNCPHMKTLETKESASAEIDDPNIGIQLSVTISPIFDEKGEFIQCVHNARDITERKKMEESLKENEEKFRGFFSGNPEATVFTDPSMHIADINPRFMSLFGYSLDEVKSKHLIDVIVPEVLVGEGRMLDKKAAEGYVYHDTARVRKDGSLIPVSVSAAPISVQGQLIGYIGVYKDISQQKSAEKKLAMMNEKLRVIGGLTRHDVRNKLSIITANAYLSKKRLQDRPEVVESFRDIDSACDMIVRIFDFARDYERLGVEELTYVDIEDCAQKAASFFSNIDGTVIENECHGVTVLADSLLRQLFYNLIDNSLKYGEHVTRINIRHEKSAEQLELIYEDDGVGISAEAKSRIFSEGYTTGKGSGYGLYFIKKMMEVYGWEINESGTSGKGAQFVMTIPRINDQGKENYRITE